jgi:hypothetical protein
MCMALGDGHSPVNCPIKPRFASLRANGRVEGAKTTTLGISAAFLKKWEGKILGALAYDETKA